MNKHALALFSLGLAGCLGAPSPLAPALRGSIGVPHHGVITNAVALPKTGEGYQLLRDNERRWGNPRLVAAIEEASKGVIAQRPGGPRLVIGDLSARFGGEA